MTALALVFYMVAAVIVAATVLPIWQTSLWWVRLSDFPRNQIAILALTVLILMPLALEPLTATELVLFVTVMLAALWQISWIWRYLPGAPLEVPSSDVGPSAPGRFGLLTTNLFQDCRALLQIISDEGPDLILAVETDEWWCSRLSQALRTRYPYGRTYPLSNGYGMAMFSRLELLQPTIRFLVDDAIGFWRVTLGVLKHADQELCATRGDEKHVFSQRSGESHEPHRLSSLGTAPSRPKATHGGGHCR